MTFLRKRFSQDMLAIVLLIALWWLFFWRLFTPNAADRVSLIKGDFSGQFVAFASYQYQRLAAGEVPLWNPYNNGGLPFIADTQAAVFYPPRLITIALSHLSGGWTYNALQMEMTAHVLLYSLLMYLFIRRLTSSQQIDQRGSIFGSFVAAVIAAYGGFTSGYPPLQLAILEAGIWLPLAALGIHTATRGENFRWLWLCLTGFALGLSWMAGHPQTTFFLTYFLIAYLAYRVYLQRYSWRIFLVGAALFGLVAFGLAAVQLVPGVEYLLQTTRAGLGFDAKGNGFPFQDILQFVFPTSVSLWSPLYVGIVGLVLALTAIWRNLPESRFWGIVAFVALLLSFGANSVFFHTLYNLLPGLNFFRGQERAAYLVANSFAMLAGMSAAHIIGSQTRLNFSTSGFNTKIFSIAPPYTIRHAILLLVGFMTAVTTITFVLWLGNAEDYAEISLMIFSTLIAAALLFLLPRLSAEPQNNRFAVLLCALLVFELFTVNMDNSNYESIPAEDKLQAPTVLQPLMEDNAGIYRVDGFRGLTDNYGSLYNIMDMRGISPLFLSGPHAIIERDYINPRAWEVFAVRYVFTDWTELPVESEMVSGGEDRWGGINVHQLSDPRPFAMLIYNVDVAPGDTFAHELLFTPDYNPRTNIILERDPGIPLRAEIPPDAAATVIEFAPEAFSIETTTPTSAILSIAHVDYSGWQATIDGEPIEILRAYGGLSAVVVPSGTHQISFIYDPLSYKIGTITSLFTWGGMVILTVVTVVRHLRTDANSIE